MLASMKDILSRANEDAYAVLAPNIFSELDARAYLEAAEDMRSPIILGIAYPTTKDLIFTGKMAVSLAEQSKVPTAVHLDHGADMRQVMKAVRGGLTSVMIDASSLPFAENVLQVKQVVKAVAPLGISVEAEIGHVGQGTDRSAADCLTDPKEAAEFMQATGIDACAVSIGTAHGTYKGTPKLDFKRLEEIKTLTGAPLVLHGSSGTGEANIRKACRLGINKVNVCNDVLKTAYEALKKTDFTGNDVYDFWPFLADTLRDFIKEQIDMVGSEGKAWTAKSQGLPRGAVTMRE